MGDEPTAWSVLIEMKGPEHAGLDPEDPRLENLFNSLFDLYGAAMSAGGNDVCVRLTVEGDELVTHRGAAALRGRNVLIEAMRLAGLDPWPVVNLQAHTFEELRRQAS